MAKVTFPHSTRSRTRTRRGATLLAAAAVVLASSGCDFQRVDPPGDGPMRYRDEIFPEVDVTTAIPYGLATTEAGEEQTLLLDMYQPAGDALTLRPAIVWIHGGAFMYGDRSSAEIVDQATTFARKGFVTVSIDYRLSPGNCYGQLTTVCPQAVTNAKHDAQAAVRWLRANAAANGIDVRRIAAAGSSAGGITALNVGYGPEDVGDSGNPGPSSAVRAAVSFSGARIETHADPGEASALLFNGTADPLISYRWAVDTVAEAEAADLNVVLTTWPGAGHVPYDEHREQIIAETTNFLWWQMGLSFAPT